MGSSSRFAKVKVGDEIKIFWKDIVAYGRVDIEEPDSQLPLAMFCTLGKVSALDKEKIVVLTEEEITNPGQPHIREPVVIPLGVVHQVFRSARWEEVTVR